VLLLVVGVVACFVCRSRASKEVPSTKGNEMRIASSEYQPVFLSARESSLYEVGNVTATAL